MNKTKDFLEKNKIYKVIELFQSYRDEIFNHEYGPMGYFLDRDGLSYTLEDLNFFKEIDPEMYEKYKLDLDIALYYKKDIQININ